MADRAELRGPASWPAVIAALTWLVTFAMLQWSVVRFEIGPDQLKFINGDLKEVLESGQFDVQLGLDSRDVLQQSFHLV